MIFQNMLKRMKAKYSSLATNQKLVILVIILLLGAFYWFQIRPSQIKIKCESKTVTAMAEMTKMSLAINEKNFWDWRNDYYQSCLHRYGL